MEAGIELAQFYLGEALRIFNTSTENPALSLAEKCFSWAKYRGNQLSLVELYQSGPNLVRDKAKALTIVQILEDHGWIRKIKEGTFIKGKKRRDVWELHP